MLQTSIITCLKDGSPASNFKKCKIIVNANVTSTFPNDVKMKYSFQDHHGI